MIPRARVIILWLAATSALAFSLHVSLVAQPPSAAQPPAADASRRERFERAYRASNLGIARLEQFDYGAAAAAFRDAIGIEPSLAAAHFNLAVALFYDGHADAAEPEARAADAAMPGAPQPPYLLGLIAKSLNRPEDAAAAFKRVLAIDPHDTGANVNLAQVYLQQHDTAPAIALFRTAVANEPSNVTAAYGLATALVRAGQTFEGQEAMKRFQALRDSAYGVTYAQGYLQQGRYAEAIVSTGAESELVDPATPAVSFKDAAPDGFDRLHASDVTLFDADGDGNLDLLVAGATALHLFHNDSGRFTDATAPSGLQAQSAVAAVAGDYDNDGRPDVFLLRDAGNRLLHQTTAGAFEDVTSKVIAAPSAKGARSAAFVDVDHDGDLDLVISGVGPAQLLRNNGNATFTDIAAAAGFANAPSGGIAIVPTDFDNHRDVDVLIVAGAGAPALFQNNRDGTFRDVARAVGLPGNGSYSAAASGDINKDGFVDFFFGRPDGPGLFAMSDGRARFAVRAAPDASRGATAAMFLDYDNDGLLDLLASTPSGPVLFRNLGDRWVDVTGPAGLAALVPSGRRVLQIAAADLDGDGDTDVVVRLDDGAVRVWRNDGGNRLRSLRVRLTARISNRSTFGTRVEMRAGGLRQEMELTSATPAAGPADALFGLGSRSAADIVRVLWPSGILQTELAPAGAAPGPIPVPITELDRKPSSCPFLFTWNGTRFDFVTDFMGGGEMGDWVAPAVWDRPDPDEYVRIRGDQLRPRDGRYELRVTNELEEAMFLDRVQLLAVDHPADADVFPNEGLRDPPRPPFRLYATRRAHPPVRATDEHGHDVLPLVRSLDRRYPDDFALSPIRGYAAAHTLTLDPGPNAENAVLLLTGWTDYAFSTDNVAAGQSGITMQPPVVQVQDTAGKWVTAIPDMGFPVGRPQTVVVDLRGRFRGPSHVVRIVTNMRIYWDRILVDTSGGRIPLRTTRIAPASADLRRRGFSAEVSPDGREPLGYDYTRVSVLSPWKTPAGRYTRYGDVLPLVSRTDDMFVVAAPGDEIALSFDAARFPPLPAGWSRTFLLYADGYSKEMNIRSATPDALAPLPFHSMRAYPYGPGEHYPDTPAYRRYLARYNTRVVAAPVPSLERSAAALLDANRRR
jgi:cytochrome c-type biogenesis protein CcmH/NrfG